MRVFYLFLLLTISISPANLMANKTIDYFKSISVLVYLGQIAPFLLLLFSMFLAFYRVKKVSNFIFRCFVIISAFFMTPMLLWPSLAGVWVLLSPKRR